MEEEEEGRMNLHEFAERYGISLRRIHRDGCGDLVINGWTDSQEVGDQIFDGYAGGLFGVCLMPSKVRSWALSRKKLRAAGFTIRQDGENEGIASFDPADEKQARLAMRLAHVHRRKKASRSQIEALAKASRAAATARRRILGGTQQESQGIGA